MNKAVIYARYSSSSQNEQSIETQIDICKNYAKENDILIVDYYIDKGMTGTNANRPGFQKMIMDSYTNKFNYLIVYKFDRFARDEYDDIYYEKILNDNGVSRLSATEPTPKDEFSSKLIKAITRLNNENYSRVLSERVNAGLSKNVERGLMVGGSVTWGYKMINKRYVIDDETAQYVKSIFDWYYSGLTGKEIANKLNLSGVRNAKGKKIQFQHIFKILRNKRYIGIFTYRGIEHKDYLPSIVSKDIFYKVQDKLSKSRNIQRNRSTKTKYSLTGKLFCGECGHAMSGYSGTGRHGKKFHYYRCRNPKCSKSNEKKKELESLIFDKTSEEIIHSNKLDGWIEDSIKAYNSQFATLETLLKNIQKELLKIKREIDNVMTAIKMGIITDSTKIELEYLEGKKRELELEYIKKEAIKPQAPNPQLIKNWFLHFNTIDPTQEEINDVFDVLISKIIKSNDTIEIYFQIGNHHVEVDLPLV